MVELLLSVKNININIQAGAETDRRIPLHDAAENGHADICRVLMDRGAALTARDSKGKTPIVCFFKL